MESELRDWSTSREPVNGDTISRLRATIEAAETAGDVRTHAELLNELVLAYWRTGSFLVAERTARQVLQLPGVPDAEVAEAWSHLGMLAWLRGSLAEGARWCERAIALASVLNDYAALAAMLNRHGLVLLSQGRIKTAEQTFQRSLDLRHATGNAWGRAFGLTNMARVNAHQGRYDLAHDRLMKAEGLFKAINSLDGRILVYTSLGGLWLHQGQPAMAIPSLDRALDFADRISEKLTTGKGEIHCMRARAYIQLGQPAAARLEADAALALVRRVGSREFIAYARGLQAEMWAAEGCAHLADRAFLRAIRHFKRLGARIGLLHTQWAFVDFLRNASPPREVEAELLAAQVRADARRLGLALPARTPRA